MSGLTNLRVLALAILATPLVVLGVLWLALPSDDAATTPHRETLLLVAATGLAGLALIWLVGYRCRAYREGIPRRVAVERGARDFVSMTVRRTALAEVPFLVGIAMAFLAPYGGLLALAAGAGITMVLVLLHVLPNRAQVRRVQRSLERKGARVPLVDAYAK
ncbi:hypothetical protein [Nocardioides sp. AE5]|uniref:hypothetical protein n=1 Tax=Nocardioides sp. AE5 TaxID=2962573 RepID=UPI002881213E|nr:hypothetical protein [Nocardioides sp. AE5]MDT0200763.1 hypothetical protein [Nocardioides sp. AE5]